MCIKNLMQKNEQSKFWHDQLDQVDQLKKGNLVKLVKLVMRTTLTNLSFFYKKFFQKAILFAHIKKKLYLCRQIV